jgi:hypothetical protein
MGTVDLRLAADLRDRLKLRRVVETGTFRGITARSLASLFDSVITIELSHTFHQRAAIALSDLPHVQALLGRSAEVLHTATDREIPTLYFLDGHWSAGDTDGVTDQCPVLEEIMAIGRGHPYDCLIIDDARLFTAAPPPPLDAGQWPTITQVFDTVRSQRPWHVVTVLRDQIIAVPQRAKPAIDAYGARVHDTRGVRYRAHATAARGLAVSTLATIRGRCDRRR